VSAKSKLHRRVEIVEKHSTTVDTGDLRRAISALASAANVASEALRVGRGGERDRGRAVIDQATAGLAALAFAQIPREVR
jgi:hypothetical protein